MLKAFSEKAIYRRVKCLLENNRTSILLTVFDTFNENIIIAWHAIQNQKPKVNILFVILCICML